MKNLVSVFYSGMFVFLLIMLGSILFYDPIVDGVTVVKFWPVTLFVFVIIMAFWANSIFKAQSNDAKNKIAELEEKKEDAFSRLMKEREALSKFASTEFSPDEACHEVSILINTFGQQWWRNYGKNILSKLFFERQSTKASEGQYLKEFLKELAQEAYPKELIGSYFSVVPAEDLPQILAEVYRDYAVDLINGGDTVLLENLTLMLKKAKPRGLEETFQKFGKMAANLYEPEVRQKILAIVKAEVEEAQA